MLRFMLSAVVGFTLTTAGVRADEPKPPSVYLEDLKYEILIAERRGQNVAAISDALDTFEKALAKKNATKVNGAPPELTALRDAVEAAAKKGENVEAISKELGIIEKSLTGRAYERPKPVEPQVEPDPPPPPPPVPPLRMGRRPGDFGPNFGGGRRPGNPGFNPGGANPGVPNVHSTSVAVANGQFIIKSLQGDVTYTITGHTKDNSAIKVVILVDEKKKVETDDLKKVPDEYRPTVEKLLKMIK